MSRRRKTRLGLEGVKPSGVVGLPLPTSLGTWEMHRSSLEACAGSLLCVCVHVPSPGTSAWATQAPQSLSCFQTPESSDLKRAVLSPWAR